MATVSLESVEAGAWGERVSRGLTLVPVVVAETEAAAVTIARGEVLGPGEGGSRDFGRRRRDPHSQSHLHPFAPLLFYSVPLLRPFLHGVGEFGNGRRVPERLSTA